jgi:hypothetical protein
MALHSGGHAADERPDDPQTPDGIMVTVSVNGRVAEPSQDRPTRFALMMRRQRANAARKQGGRQQLPAILPGDCPTCAGLGVYGSERERCQRCGGSGEV